MSKVIDTRLPLNTAQERREERIVRVERLEYGKYCQSHNGPIIEGKEHGHLGFSPQFPKELLPFCLPTHELFGVIGKQDEKISKSVPHGTVLRPLSIGGATRSVMCRVKQLPENPCESLRRVYTAARYITGLHGTLSPSTLFEAMELSPIQGLTQEQAGLLEHFDIAEAPFPTEQNAFIHNEKAEQFFPEAFVFLFSGIPIWIDGWIDEEEFFAWVSLVWWSFPKEMRPLLGAGWGIGPTLAANLAISSTSFPGETLACFSMQEGRWKMPLKQADGKTSFSSMELAPGRIYYDELYKRGSFPVWPFYRDDHGAEYFISSQAPLQQEGLVSFGGQELRRIFRRLGLDVLDKRRLTQLSDYLTTGQFSDDRFGLRSLAQLTYQENRLVAFEMLLKIGIKEDDDGCQLDPNARAQRRRADDFIWSDLETDAIAGYMEWLSCFTGPESTRARLLLALARQKQKEIFEAMLTASMNQMDEYLPDAVVGTLEGVLKSSLGAGKYGLSLHKAFLSQNSKVYLAWLEKEHLNLALLFLEIDSQQAPKILMQMFRYAQRFQYRTAIEALSRWSMQQKPTKQDLATLGYQIPKEKRRFDQLFLRAWDGQNEQPRELRDKRERLCDWVEVLDHEVCKQRVLLGLARGVLEINDDMLCELGEEIQKDTIPQVLEPSLAIIIRKYPYHFIQCDPTWIQSRIFRYWSEKQQERFNALRGRRNRPNILQGRLQMRLGKYMLVLILVFFALFLWILFWLG